MLEVQKHRGPDDRGIWGRPGVGLGQVRLSILDLSSAGHQPMLMDDGRLSIVFNGEIFNYVEVRRDLEALGREFRSGTDTEVILHAYDEWGPDCCTRFNGMWAFALWDERLKSLFCSRDRFGVKPFYYSLQGSEFLFSSEIKGLLAASPELAEPNDAYLARFLRTSLSDDTEATFFKDVLALMPGHSVFIDVSGDRIRMAQPARYWDLDIDRAHATYDYANSSGQLRELLEDSIRLRLRADVPIGTCLSGGLDSSSIVALASRQLEGPVWTFSALYPQREYDESKFVRIVNEAFPTVPHEIWPSPGRLLDVMPKIAWHQDQPSGGPGVYSQWHVMEAASRDVKVLLDGQGADEILGGYTPYYVDYLRSRLGWMLKTPTPSRVIRTCRDWTTVADRVGDDFMKQFVLSFMGEGSKKVLRTFRSREHRPEVRPEFLNLYSPDEDPWRVEGPFRDRLSNMLYDATFRRSLPALLRYEDRNSMAFSIEARTPFLDYRLVEFALSLPFDERIDGEWTKSVLRRGMQGILPDAVNWRKDKMGYPTPFAVWLRSEFRDDAEEIIFSEKFKSRAVFDQEVVEIMWRQHLEGSRDNSWNIWRWMTVEFWFREFIDG